MALSTPPPEPAVAVNLEPTSDNEQVSLPWPGFDDDICLGHEYFFAMTDAACKNDSKPTPIEDGAKDDDGHKRDFPSPTSLFTPKLIAPKSV